MNGRRKKRKLLLKQTAAVYLGLMCLPGVNGNAVVWANEVQEASLFSDGSELENGRWVFSDLPKQDESGNSGEGMYLSGNAYDGGVSSGGVSSGGGQGSTRAEKIYRQPKFILESSSLAGQQIPAGQEVELTAVFRNMSQSEAAYNLLVTLKAADESVSIATPSFYFAKVPAQNTITIPTTVQAAVNTEEKKTSITVSFEYENVKGETYTFEEPVALELYQPAQASVEGFRFAEQVYSGETVTTDLRICNTGRAPVYNVRAELTGQGLFAREMVFAGTLEPGTAYDGSLKLYVGDKNMTSPGVSSSYEEENAYGEASGTLKLLFEDAYGKEYTETTDFATVILKPGIMELKAEKEEKAANQWWAASLTAMALLFTAILAGMGRKLRKKKNQIADLLALQEERHVP